MASTKDLKNRISTVQNTQQTTRAMKMVSAAKLRRAQDAIVSNRPYAKSVSRLIKEVGAQQDDLSTSPLLIKEAGEQVSTSGLNACLVMVTSDRGLCGGFNSAIIKAAEKWTNENRNKYKNISLVCVGKKGNEYFSKRQSITLFMQFGKKVTFKKAEELSDWLVNQYLTNEADEVHIIYNEFKNAMTQEVVVERQLPLLDNSLGLESEESVSFVLKPNAKGLLDALIEKHFSIQIFRVLLESQASEHGSRMSAMESATKNAEEMIRSLTLQYNKQRQAGITKELLEIISGSESQKA